MSARKHRPTKPTVPESPHQEWRKTFSDPHRRRRNTWIDRAGIFRLLPDQTFLYNRPDGHLLG